MLKNTLIIALVIVIIYLYYQQRKNQLANFTSSASPEEIQEVKKVNQIFADFCKNEIGGQDIQEIRTKLNGRKLTEILEENEDYETTVDKLTRKKGELEGEITSLTNAWKNRVNEKERIITRFQEEQKELQTKIKKKAKSLDEEQCENNKLTKKIEQLEEKIKELNQTNLEESKTVHELSTKLQNWEKESRKWNQQLKQINLLFDPQAQADGMIDFNNLYSLLENLAKEPTSPPPIYSKQRKKKN